MSKSEYSLKVYVTDDKGTRLVEIPPMAQGTTGATDVDASGLEAKAARAGRSLSPKARSGLSTVSNLGLLGLIEQGDAGADTETDDAELGYPGWTLLKWAASSCIRGYPVGWEISTFTQPWYDDPGEGQYWYIFSPASGSGTDCDFRLAHEEVLLCTADRLAEVADSVGKVTWDGVDGSSPITITIPPQATKDKFIARDMAMNVLAHLAKFSRRPGSASWPVGSTCDDAYVALADGAGWEFTLPRQANPSRTVPEYFPPSDAPDYEEDVLADVPEQRKVGAARLERKAILYSAAGKLMQDLIQKSVAADLAGAEAQRANAGDPADGIKAMWGEDAEEPYNSLRHAASVLYGRMEMGDPGLENVPSWDPAGPTAYAPTCDSSFAPPLHSRNLVPAVDNAKLWQALVPPSTPEQARALTLLQSAGIVIDPGAYQSLLDGTLLAGTPPTDVVEGQLLLNAAALTGRTSAELGILGDAVVQQWQATDPADRMYAVTQTHVVAGILSRRLNEGIYNSDLDRATDAGLAVRPSDGGETLLETLHDGGGFVVDGGLPVGDLAIDVTARLSRVQVQNQCEIMAYSDVYHASDDERLATQGAFEVGAVLSRALRRIEMGVEASTSSTLGGLRDFLPQAIDAVNAWVGPLEVHYRLFGLYVEMLLSGYESFGMTPTELQQRLVLVSDYPHLADCVAGIRTTCPSPADLASQTISATNVYDTCTGDAHERAARNGCVSLLYPFNGASGLFYIVLKGTSAAKGAVLGAINPLASKRKFTTISTLRNELANEAFGTSRPTFRGSSCAGVTPSLERKSYCIEKMDRDMFVPLANELTAESGQSEDSWKHYLMEARQAAEKADELGNQLIDVGTRRELRKEAAVEEVGNLCGTYPNADSLSFSGAAPPQSATGAAINDCVGEPTIDLVVLTEDTFVQDAQESGYSSDQDLIRDLYCTGAHQPAFCSSSDPIEHRGLGLQRSSDLPTTVLANECGGAIAAMPPDFGSGDVNLDAWGDLTSKEWASQIGLGAAITGLNLWVWESQWVLEEHKRPLMADADWVQNNPERVTAQEEIWPACQQLGLTCTGLATTLSQVFPAGATIDDQAEVAIVTQVQRVLWRMGAMGGLIPAGTMHMPMPINDRWIPAVYASDMPETPIGTEWSQIVLGGGFDSNDHSLLGIGPATDRAHNLWNPPVSPPGYRDAVFDRWASVEPEPTPEHPETWIRQMYNEGKAYSARVRLFSTPEGNADIAFVTRLDSPRGGSDVYTRDQLGLWLQMLGQGFNGDSVGWSVALSKMDSSEGHPEHGRYICGDATSAVFGYAPHGWSDPVVLNPAAANADIAYTQPGDPEECANSLNDGPAGNDAVRLDEEPQCANNAVLRPSLCRPSERMEMYWPKDHSLHTVGQALALSCVVATRGVSLADDEVPPPIETLYDLQKLELWIGRAARASDQTLARMALFDVPQRVVDDFNASKVGSGTVGQGEHGRLLLRLSKAAEGIHASWIELGAGFRQLNAALTGTRLRLEAAELEKAGALMQLAKEQLELNRQNALLTVREVADTILLGLGVVGTAASITGGTDPISSMALTVNSAAGLAECAVNREYNSDLKRILAQQPDYVDDVTENSSAQALASLDGELATIYASIEGALSGIRSSTADALDSIIALQQNQGAARFALARAAEADFVETQTGPLPLHVNTVYRRQFDVTQMRYESALDTAKRAAYVARLAIEQRLGVRMNHLTQELGPLPAPASWVDNLCSVQGVNYDKLKEADPEAAGGETFDVAAFADQYIGDYVDKLDEFVEFYNIEYPFKEGTDTAVVSLREDMRHQGQRCLVNGANLLYQSQRLYERGTLDGDTMRGGWRSTGCSDTLCQEVDTVLALADVDGNPTLFGPNGETELSWLTTATPAADAVLWDEMAPPAMVYQSVDLRTGTDYVLSWWDLARVADSPEYRVAVYDNYWTVVATSVYLPDATVDTWSARRLLEFMVPENGVYHIGLQASAGRTEGASIVISSVQLEAATKVLGPSAYQPTGKGLSSISNECDVLDGAGWREAFRRVCTAEECYWEMKDALVVDMESVNHGVSSLTGKFARGNYNYRHGSVALNLVGTGVLDCGDDTRMSCYGSGFVEYELEHTAANVQVLDNGRDTHCFDFRVGKVRGGKALATERFLTLPMSSADKGLIEQSGFLKGELAGRPLDGVYRLRIKETPALRWENLEDIQLVFNYGYWSAVDVANAL